MKYIGCMLGMLFGVLILVPVLCVSLFVNAWALSTLWGWFVVPLGIMDISYWHALGLSSFVSLWKIGIASTTDVMEHSSEEVGASRYFRLAGIHLIAVPAIVGLGWIFQTMM